MPKIAIATGSLLLALASAAAAQPGMTSDRSAGLALGGRF